MSPTICTKTAKTSNRNLANNQHSGTSVKKIFILCFDFRIVISIAYVGRSEPVAAPAARILEQVGPEAGPKVVW